MTPVSKIQRWALLLAHYAVRAFMHEAAQDTNANLDRISFMRALRVIRRQVTDQAALSPTTLATAITTTVTEIVQRLKPARRYRSCPRAVKSVRRKSQRIKQPHQTNLTPSRPSRSQAGTPPGQLNGIGPWARHWTALWNNVFQPVIAQATGLPTPA
jgi:hypothetical protein